MREGKTPSRLKLLKGSSRHRFDRPFATGRVDGEPKFDDQTVRLDYKRHYKEDFFMKKFNRAKEIAA